MKREIKFRAWFPETKVMLPFDQYYFCYEYGTLSWALDKENEFGGIACGPEDYDAAIVMQYTGLKDKTGNDIFEGDIIRSPFTDDPVPVIWDQEFAQFTFGGAEFNVEVKPEEVEVVGNIHEHPHLLTPQDEQKT